MNEEIFNSNLRALQQHPAALKVATEVTKRFRESVYKIETTKSGVPTLLICEDNLHLSMHSRYNPVAESLKQLETAYSDQSHAIVMGFGLGYISEELVKMASCSRIFIVEPDPEVFIAALRSRDLTALFSDSRVTFCIDLSSDETGELWNGYLDWSVFEQLAIIDHPPTRARFNDYFNRVVDKVRYLCNRSKGNLVTLMYAGSEFHSNNFSNLASCFALPGVDRLFDKFKSVPTVVVAAGPSLDKNVHLLKEIKGRFLIIAVDTALRQLIDNGVKPDIVCAADPSYENSLDFVGVENEKDVILVAEPMTHPDIFDSFQGSKMITTFGGGLYPIYKSLREPVGEVVCWGSVATTAFDLALKLGAEPVIFIGLDLSFEDGRLHGRGSYSDDLMYEKTHSFTSIEHECADYIYTRGLFRFTRSDGKVLYTDKNMKLYRDWFEDQFRQTSVEIINATEGGIVEMHMVKKSLSDVIKEYGDRSVDIRQIIEKALHSPVKADVHGLLKILRKFRKILKLNENAVKKSIAISKRLLVLCANIPGRKLIGKDATEFYGITKLHDEICAEKIIFDWFSVYQTRSATKHLMKIVTLKNNKNTTVKEWLEEMDDFFAAMDRFHTFQLPMLEKAIASVEKVNKSNHTLEGDRF